MKYSAALNKAFNFCAKEIENPVCNVIYHKKNFLFAMNAITGIKVYIDLPKSFLPEQKAPDLIIEMFDEKIKNAKYKLEKTKSQLVYLNSGLENLPSYIGLKLNDDDIIFNFKEFNKILTNLKDKPFTIKYISNEQPIFFIQDNIEMFIMPVKRRCENERMV